MERYPSFTTAIRIAGSAFLVGMVAAVFAASSAWASCQFSSGSTTGAVSFPVLDPVTAPNVTAGLQLNVRCTPASDFAVAQWTWSSANGGATLGRLAGGSPPYPPGIGYSVSVSVASQGSNGTLTLTLQIAGPSYINASAGSYSDVLTLQVTP